MIILARPRAATRAKRWQSSSRGDDVRADVAERRQPPVLGERREAAEAAAGDVLEEDALDRILRAEREDLLEPWFDRVSHGSNGRTG